MKNKLYPLFTYLIRTFYPIGFGKLLHFLLKKFNLLSDPMGNMRTKISNSALILNQFEKLNDNLNHRKIIATIYSKSINTKILSPKIIKQIPLSTNLRFPIFVENRDSLIQFLAGNQIFVSDIWYDAPISPKKYLEKTDYNGQCPNAKLASEEILNLPTHINVDEKAAENISNLINQWLQQKR